ncbi:carbohydrate ABC transporter permease [Tuanshanicoccus lijuaniae]|uniref:carbohydrate ABC transporter permease n=1 Tax=Aerococcaceae bacterium zg-1292 TaxID=2774330 RepID=UPI0019352D0B|nr:carbohydrate ABC transporter permease [Aerococcaceae bacterium zg-1292]MBF6626402.1 carbohydrate ABC transporter permease [Aerococcaceae bacterium zg-BR9]MBF6979156.1 carbohydrate ABC transporter permease [Aerococcaceae bacterium zg-BR22]MBS4455725.1 carbohydrate ABC transporter permease [Aerococcaceae bacterium zg-A91]MBS4457476.1 carbohydrate ABC transporter permease [Aerococcaceae bacterium zg-BR33]
MKKNNVLTYVFLILMSIVFAFPFYFMIVSATNASVDVTKGSLLPGKYLAENFKNLLNQTDMLLALKNSAIIALSQTALALLISSIAGYAFEIYRSKTTDFIFNVILTSMMIPFAALMIPLFRLFGKFSAIHPSIGFNSYASAFLPYIATAFLIFYFRQNTKMFQQELLEAGRIDGLSEIGLFFRIYVPTMKNTYAAAAIITFMSAWNNYLWPLVALQTNEVKTVPLLLSNLGSSYAPDFGLMMIAILIATIPTIAIFFILQKYFVAGMLGAVK